MIPDHKLIAELVSEQSWTDKFVGEMALNFLEEKKLLTKFSKYLQEVANEENGYEYNR
jgi:hypothetical protein